MKCAIKVILKKYSYKSIETLINLNFTIYIENMVSGVITVIDTIKDVGTIIDFDTLNSEIVTITAWYNDKELPSDCILTLLKKDANVKSCKLTME